MDYPTPRISTLNQSDSSAMSLIRTQWYQLKITPDPVAGDQLSVGVMVQNEGQLYKKFIEDFGRLECAYGSEIVKFIQEVYKLIDDITLEHLESYQRFSPQLSIDFKGVAKGYTIDEILTRLLDTVAPLSRKHHSRKDRFKTVRTSHLIVDVKEFFKSKYGDSDLILPPDGKVVLVRGDVTIPLNLPLYVDETEKFGGIVSTVYSTNDKLELEFMRSISDLQFARDIVRGGDFALFALSAEEEILRTLRKTDRDARNASLSYFKNRISALGISYYDEPSQVKLAEEIAQWSGVDARLNALHDLV